jgi:uncharacterized repeat protein (TIGR03803 family)
MSNPGFERNGFRRIALANATLVRFACIFVCAAAFCVATAVATHAQSTYLKTLANFDGKDGGRPNGALVQGFDGNYYGVTGGGTSSNCSIGGGCGTVFRLTSQGDSQGKLTTIYNFCSQADCADGASPSAGLTLGTNGNLYGTTSSGGTEKEGTVFEITPGGKLTTLYSFCQIKSNHICVDGQTPVGVIEGSNGNLYGVTEFGGTHSVVQSPTYGCGTFYQLTPAGTLTTLHDFCAVQNLNGSGVDGLYPDTPVVEAFNGLFYGVTAAGGKYGLGNVFEVDPSGALETVYSFCSEDHCPDGDQPAAGLSQTSNGQLAGTTYSGGTYDVGTVFEITTGGALTTLYSFCPVMNSNFSCDDGEYPTTGVVQQADGMLLGTSGDGGPYSEGTAYQLTESGTLTVLYSFCANGTNCVDGEFPDGLLAATNGFIYGATFRGGEDISGCGNGCGTLFGMLPISGGTPFVEAVPNSGEVGRTVNILGPGLTGSTAVNL